MKKYVVILTERRLVIDASSEEDAKRLAAQELKEKIKPEYLIIREDPTAHYEVDNSWEDKMLGKALISIELTEAEKLLQAWADPLPPNGRLYWEHVNKAREYFKGRAP